MTEKLQKEKMIGKIVHYVLDFVVAESVFVNGPTHLVHRPAIITDFNEAEQTAQMCVFLKSDEDALTYRRDSGFEPPLNLRVWGVPYSEEPKRKTWHWIPE